MSISFRRGPVVAAAGFILACALAAPGCNTSPTAPKHRAVLTVTPPSLNFGNVCQTQSRTLTVVVRAPKSNTDPVSGTVAESCDALSITAGAGPYTLQPGDSMVVSVKYAPSIYIPLDCAVSLGDGRTTSVPCKGAGVPYPWLFSQVLISTNGYSLAGSSFLGNWDINEGSGVSYGNPSWANCGNAWVFNGNPFTESLATISGIHVPAGVKSILVQLHMDAESSCTQLLVQLDGNRETVKSSLPTKCSNKAYRISWPFRAAGTHNIAFGTDQQGVTCWDNLAIEWIQITFEGVCPTSVAGAAAPGIDGTDAGMATPPMAPPAESEIEELQWRDVTD